MDKAEGAMESERVVDVGIRLRMRGEERRITVQHERLDGLCREVYIQIEKHGPGRIVGDYLLFMAVLEAHMKIEEEIYFPALHGLRADAGSELEDLIVEHLVLGEEALEVRDLLKANDRAGARVMLDRFARRLARHEAAEEDLIARITEGPVSDFGHSSLC
ncbi:MAG: hypothetical protein CL933_12060 [Deltaproteobacteria bacterium]|nr:hypothetical protein [Deltaproteobacteria bacterium]